MRLPLAPLLLSMTAWAASAAALAADPQTLAKERNCMACHASASRLVGPSFQEVQERLSRQRGGESARAALALSIRQGSKGSWGAVPMPPNPQVSESEALDLARWIASDKSAAQPAGAQKK